MSNWTIRIAGLVDAKCLESCMHRAYSIYKERLENQTLPPLQANYASEISKFPTWVAESDGKIVGGLVMCFENDRAILSNIAVDTDFQGHGLGRGLLEFAEKRAKERGFKKLHLATHVLLVENLAIYKHLGWKETNREGARIFFEKEPI